MTACYSHRVLSDSFIIAHCRAEPHSLGTLMALYEGNFVQLIGLVPALLTPLVGTRSVSSAVGDLDLHLQVDAATRYTVDLRLTYLFEESQGLSADPDLNLRLYLDARMVEVVSWSNAHRHAVLRELAFTSSRELDRRWSKNIMLGKWLDYLADRGHKFEV